MTPIKTAATNDTLAPPPGHEDDVIPLPIIRTRDGVTSCWGMTIRERLRVLWTGRVWFDCMGHTHPAIRLRV